MLPSKEKQLAYSISHFKEALNKYLSIKKHTISSKSLKVYREKLEHLEDFLWKEQNYFLNFDLNRAICFVEYLKEQGLAPKTIKHVLTYSLKLYQRFFQYMIIIMVILMKYNFFRLV